MPTEQKQAQKKDIRRRESAEQEPTESVVEEGAALKEEIDKLLDEIDELLEKDDGEFAKNYIQRGGE